MNLIDKDALVAEIERIISIAESQLALFGKEDERNRIIWAQQKKVCELFLSFVNSLEVKEVVLDKEIDSVEDRYHGFESLSRADIIDIAKYFFSLGLSVNTEKEK